MNDVLINLKTRKLIIISICLLFGFSQWSIAQSNQVKGKVTDEKGEAMIGASVVQKGTSNGITTDANGSFTIDVPGNATLVISYLGYVTTEVRVNNQQTLSIRLEEDSQLLGEVVVVGYGTQRKVTLTGSVSAVKGSDMVTTVNENAQNMLTGKIPGVRIVQKTAEPGGFNNSFDIRGFNVNGGSEPLVVIDGIPRTRDDFQRLDPYDIENVSILKDASAAIYGVRAANGVVLVSTKKGNKGNLELNYSGTFTAQVPSGLPATLGAIDYMTIRNERSMHSITGGSLVYNDDKFNEYLTGKKQSTDWYSEVFADYAPQTMHNLSATGGNDRITFYSGLGYEYQEGFFKSGDLNYEKYNIRTNITAKISDRLTFDMNLSSVIDEQNRPYQDSWWIIRGFWRQNPLMPVYADPERTMLYHGLIEGDNPVSFMQNDVVGYKKYGKKWFSGTGSLSYDIPGIKGLTAKGLLSANYYVSDTKLFNKAYNQYRYDEASQTYSKYTRQSPNSLERQTYMRYDLVAQAMLNYNRIFNMDHKVSAILVWEVQKHTGDNFLAKRFLALPLDHLFAGVATDQLATMNAGADGIYENANNALAGRVNYTYADKYLVEAQFRYDGSSKFAPGSQWGFFPSVSTGWRISEENFFKESNLSFIDQLKLRASYGILGDDNASAYQFISGYNFPSNTDKRRVTGGFVFDNFIPSANNKGIPNSMITWFKSKTLNVGIDVDAWKNLFGFTLEFFNRDRSGLLTKRNGGIPTVVGAILPDENLNSDRTFGYELELRHQNKIGDLTYQLKGITTLTRNKYLYKEHGSYGSSWDNWKNNQENRLQGIHKGYGSAGRFQSWEDIWSYPIYTGRGTLPGDYKYEDW
ncbi:MAG: SusC/RagA family TonB-linked outer membrane protein, partial [Dysgonamonadaceae bacterium]|nr:SusC/RagA family TonB-linked outer membrane protein [Dysgonamonadaceae bacterium]